MRRWKVVASNGREFEIAADAMRWVKDSAILVRRVPYEDCDGLVIGGAGILKDDVVAVFTGPASVTEIEA